MRFSRLRLSNFKPYGDVDLRFRDGVTVIHGLNGSGKSSLLEACFFTLYGSKALPGTLDDVIRNGTDEAAIELWFTHDGVDYHIERQLRKSGDRVTTSKCVLEGDDGSGEPVSRDGARAVRQFITELLRMDSEAFVNCAYVRQGEVNKLINATPQQRQDMLDDLLQLGMLETYRDRAGQARLGVEDVLTAARGSLETVDDQIEAKESQNLHKRLNERESDLGDVESEIDNYEQQRQKAETARDEASETLSAYESHQTEIQELEAEIQELESEISQTATERDELGDRRRTARETRDEREADLADLIAETELDEATAEAIADRKSTLVDRREEVGEEISDLRVRATGFENQAENLESTADELETAADEAEQAADEAEQKREELADEQSTLRAKFEGTPVEVGEATAHRQQVQDRRQTVGERLAETRATRESLEASIAEAEELLAEGNCPTCGQPVDDAPHVTGIDDQREKVATLEAELDELQAERAEIETKLNDATELVEAEATLDDLEADRERLAERIETNRETATEKRETAATNRQTAETKRSEAVDRREAAEQKREEAVDTREEIQTQSERREEITDAIERLDDLERLRGGINELTSEIERLSERRESLAERNADRREWLADKRERRDELTDEFDEAAVETARKRKQKAESYLEDVDEELTALREQRDELQNAIGGIKADISQLEELKADREALADRVDKLEAVHDETEQLEAMYGDLRGELRRKNVESLERMLNETFDLVYGNDAYSHIELDGNYELTVYQKDDQTLEPEQLSGGERALFNLSLRCAIYRLLAEGIEGAAPTPPLILDEPTVFLDSGHVGRLVDLVEEMRGFGVRQILIVSHDDELVGAADELITVEKNPTTNQSTVSHTDQADLAVLGQVGDD